MDQPALDRLIEEGLTRYGQGDLDGALVLWERVLAEDPANAQANSYVDYVRTNYDVLTSESADTAPAAAPFGIAADEDPGYVIEIIPGEIEAAGTPPLAFVPQLADDLDAGWDVDDELDREQTIDLATAQRQPPETFDDATREYDPSTRTATADVRDAIAEFAIDGTKSSAQKTEIKKRELGFVKPTEAPALRPLASPRELAHDDFEPPTREHVTTGTRDAFASFDLDAPTPAPVPTEVPSESSSPTRELPPDVKFSLAPTRDLEKPPVAPPSVVGAPTRELGLRQVAMDRGVTETDPEPRDNTRSDVVLSFDPIDARANEILELVDAHAPAGEAKDDQTRRRITRLLELAGQWSAANDLERAVAAVDLALGEDPNSALAQKLYTRNRETIMQVFQAYLGDLDQQPALARPLHELSSAPINPRAAFLLSRVDGMLSIDEILDVSGMPRLEAYRYLAQLFLRGILR